MGDAVGFPGDVPHGYANPGRRWRTRCTSLLGGRPTWGSARNRSAPDSSRTAGADPSPPVLVTRADQRSVAQLARFSVHREAKGQVQRWYDGCRIVVSEITATYGGGRLLA